MTNLSLEHFENGFKIYQDNTLYKFTSDAIKLAKFCKFKHTDRVLDMCAGCGVVGFYAYSISKCDKIFFNEIQPKMCELINKNIELNNLQHQSSVLCKDLNDLSIADFEKLLDIIVCNPPYFKVNGKIKEDNNIAICRHEIAATLGQIITKAAELLKNAGKLYIIIPADRMCECIKLMAANNIEAKKVQVYHTQIAATVCLLEGVKYGKSGAMVEVIKEGV